MIGSGCVLFQSVDTLLVSASALVTGFSHVILGRPSQALSPPGQVVTPATDDHAALVEAVLALTQQQLSLPTPAQLQPQPQPQPHSNPAVSSLAVVVNSPIPSPVPSPAPSPSVVHGPRGQPATAATAATTAAALAPTAAVAPTATLPGPGPSWSPAPSPLFRSPAPTSTGAGGLAPLSNAASPAATAAPLSNSNPLIAPGSSARHGRKMSQHAVTPLLDDNFDLRTALASASGGSIDLKAMKHELETRVALYRMGAVDAAALAHGTTTAIPDTDEKHRARREQLARLTLLLDCHVLARELLAWDRLCPAALKCPDPIRHLDALKRDGVVAIGVSLPELRHIFPELKSALLAPAAAAAAAAAPNPTDVASGSTGAPHDGTVVSTGPVPAPVPGARRIAPPPVDIPSSNLPSFSAVGHQTAAAMGALSSSAGAGMGVLPPPPHPHPPQALRSPPLTPATPPCAPWLAPTPPVLSGQVGASPGSIAGQRFVSPIPASGSGSQLAPSPALPTGSTASSASSGQPAPSSEPRKGSATDAAMQQAFRKATPTPASTGAGSSNRASLEAPAMGAPYGRSTSSNALSALSQPPFTQVPSLSGSRAGVAAGAVHAANLPWSAVPVPTVTPSSTPLALAVPAAAPAIGAGGTIPGPPDSLGWPEHFDVPAAPPLLPASAPAAPAAAAAGDDWYQLPPS